MKKVETLVKRIAKKYLEKNIIDDYLKYKLINNSLNVNAEHVFQEMMEELDLFSSYEDGSFNYRKWVEIFNEEK